MAHTMSPRQYRVLEDGYRRDNHRVESRHVTMWSLHERGLVSQPVTLPDGGAYAYLTTAGLDFLESGS